MKVIATRHFGYAGRDRREGDEFDASATDAKLLFATGRAKPAPPKTKPAPTPPRDTHAEDAHTNEDADPTEAPKQKQRGRYRRRDMRADDDNTGA